jgi:hypothetical protein
MKVRLVTTVHVDPVKWAYEYGILPDEVREDVKGYFATMAQEKVNALGLAPDSHAP